MSLPSFRASSASASRALLCSPSPQASMQAERFPARPGADLSEVVNEVSGRYRLDPDLVNSVIKAESGFNAHAVSPKGAQGLMQLMPGTASQLGVPQCFDPQANVDGGTKYLRELLERYNFDLVKALAAYNAGPQRVEQFGGVPPYYETRAYVARIVRDFNKKKAAQQKAAALRRRTACREGHRQADKLLLRRSKVASAWSLQAKSQREPASDAARVLARSMTASRLSSRAKLDYDSHTGLILSGSVIYLGWCRFPLRVARDARRGALPLMDKKRILASVVVFLILAVLVYLQYRHWRTFDWGTFWSQTHRIKKIARSARDCTDLHRRT